MKTFLTLFGLLCLAVLTSGAPNHTLRITPANRLSDVIANAAATPDDTRVTIIVGPGDYLIPTNSVNLLRDRVNWHFETGARLLSGNTSDTNSRAFFYDTSGAVTSSITGYGEFHISNLWSAILIVTNPNSKVLFQAAAVTAATNLINPNGVVAASFAAGFPAVIDVYAKGTAIENGAALTNAVKNAPSGSLVVVHPGRYHTPTNTLPSVMLKNGVDQYWEPGAIWSSGTSGGDQAYMFDDSAGVVSCSVRGYGRFYLTNDNAAILGLNTTQTVVRIEALSFDVVGSGASVFSMENGSSLDIEWKDYARTTAYDIGFGATPTGSKLRLKGSKAYPGGDLIEFDSFENWGDCIVDVDYLMKTNAGSAMQVGGKQMVRIGRADLWANSYITSYPGNTFATNGIIYDSVFQSHPSNKFSTVYYTPGGSQSGLYLKNVSIYGPTNCDALTLTNVAANPLFLENCAIYNGWAATNWARAFTGPANVHLIGKLALRPTLPSNSITMTVSATIP